MNLHIEPVFPPMEAQVADKIPEGNNWKYEPKWDGFRCVAFRDGEEVHLQSRSGKPLGRYFPDVVAGLAELPAKRFVIDGELVIPVGESVSFEELQLRLHPAASRVKKLAAEKPAMLIAFDLLVDETTKTWVEEPYDNRRARLEKFAGDFFVQSNTVSLSPAEDSIQHAREWFDSTGGGLDGVIAKNKHALYLSGERAGMVKIKNIRSADCVVAGFRYASKAKSVASLLFGLYDDDGLLHHVGYTSALTQGEREELTPQLEKLSKSKSKELGFSGAAPGAPSRWSTERSAEWEALPPKLVAEIEYDHFSGGRFRHGTRLMRWRHDKSPRKCTFDQIVNSGKEAMRLVIR